MTVSSSGSALQGDWLADRFDDAPAAPRLTIPRPLFLDGGQEGVALGGVPAEFVLVR
jgi:hypothetical protein